MNTRVMRLCRETERSLVTSKLTRRWYLRDIVSCPIPVWEKATLHRTGESILADFRDWSGDRNET